MLELNKNMGSGFMKNIKTKIIAAILTLTLIFQAGYVEIGAKAETAKNDATPYKCNNLSGLSVNKRIFSKRQQTFISNQYNGY